MQLINKLASTIANIVQPIQYTPIVTDQLALTGQHYAPVDVLCIESSKQPNVTSTEPSYILIKELG